MLDATGEGLLPARALSGRSSHALAGGSLGHPLAEAGKPAHVDLLAAPVKRLESGRDSVELRDAAGDLLVRATRYRDKTNGLLCAWRTRGTQGWPQEDRQRPAHIPGQVGPSTEERPSGKK